MMPPLPNGQVETGERNGNGEALCPKFVAAVCDRRNQLPADVPTVADRRYKISSREQTAIPFRFEHPLDSDGHGRGASGDVAFL